jgi:hypothetical protein
MVLEEYVLYKTQEFLMKKILSHKWFVILFVLAAVLRFCYIRDGVVPFAFDHGKDALAVLHMLVVPKLKLIGPWTSIPGLYFGPAWYYLLAPFALLGQFNPLYSVISMVILVLLQMYLVYRYFNLESAAIIGFSGFWIMISRSAWNPYPMTLLSIIILILLLKQLKLKKIDNKLLAGLALTASFGFHFSSAFAIFYPIIIALVLLIFKFKPNFKNILVAVGSFTIPFIPQIIFELRNNFPQTKAISQYFSSGESDAFGLEKIKNVLNVTFGEFKIILFESPVESPKVLSQIILYLVLFFILSSIYFVFKDKNAGSVTAANNKQAKTDYLQIKNIFIISLIFIFVPVFGFIFLHFNVWYVYPLIPVVTILLGSLVHKLPKLLSVAFILLYIVFSLSRLNYYLTAEKSVFLNDTVHYPVKEKIVDYIREDAGNRDFSVYTYMPDIYDFPYQYLFLTQGLKGQDLPLEFAYEPGVPTYVREKKDILNVIDSKYGERWRGTPKVIYYIVTDKSDSELLNNWWGRQSYEEITVEKEFGERIVVYTATPKKEILGK